MNEHILVIEDDESFKDTLLNLLKKKKYNVLGVVDGYQAIDMVNKEPFDLIIADVRLPGMDGIETLMKLKEARPEARSKVILMTGYADQDVPVKAIKLGVDDYIYKPFKMEEFVHSIERNMRSLRLEKEKERYIQTIEAFNEELMEKNEAINAILLSMAEGVFTIDEEWKITHFNKAAQRITGVKPEEAIGRKCTEVFKADVCRDNCPLKASMETGKAILGAETNIQTNSGRKIPIMVSSSLLKDSKGKAIGGVEIFRDISNLKEMTEELFKSKEEIKQWSEELEERVKERTRELEEANKRVRDTHSQLLQSAKMTAFGQLGAGVAHELNNPLGGIFGYAQLILRKLDDPNFSTDDFKACQKHVESIEREAARCKKIVEDMLNFSRKPTSVGLEVLTVGKLIEDALSICGHQLKLDNVNVILDLASDLASVKGVANQLAQVFTNIMLNSQQAMASKGGELIIKAENVMDEALQQPKQVRIEFTDTGCGISEEVLPRIFEPFFTNKAQKKGTGLGLSVSYQILKEHKGSIEAKSKLGEGSTFIVVLPVA